VNGDRVGELSGQAETAPAAFRGLVAGDSALMDRLPEALVPATAHRWRKLSGGSHSTQPGHMSTAMAQHHEPQRRQMQGQQDKFACASSNAVVGSVAWAGTGAVKQRLGTLAGSHGGQGKTWVL